MECTPLKSSARFQTVCFSSAAIYFVNDGLLLCHIRTHVEINRRFGLIAVKKCCDIQQEQPSRCKVSCLVSCKALPLICDFDKGAKTLDVVLFSSTLFCFSHCFCLAQEQKKKQQPCMYMEKIKVQSELAAN